MYSEVNQLWSEVAPRLKDESPPYSSTQPQNATTFWEDNLQAEWSMQHFYESLIKRNRQKEIVRGLSELCDEQKSIVRRLASLYFLKTGRRPALRECISDMSDNLEALRECYLWESKQANTYRNAINMHEMSDLLVDLGRKKENHAKSLYLIIEQMVI